MGKFSARIRAVSVIEWAARAVLLLWLAFWAFFSFGEAISGIEGAWMHLLVPLAPMALSVLLAWFRPRLGGVFLIVGGVYAALFFRHPVAWLLLSTPAIVAGGLLVCSRWARPATDSGTGKLR